MTPFQQTKILKKNHVDNNNFFIQILFYKYYKYLNNLILSFKILSVHLSIKKIHNLHYTELHRTI